MISDVCGICHARFDLLYPPNQYPTVETGAGTYDLICDDCQNDM